MRIPAIRKGLVLALAAIAILGGVSTAHADFQIRFVVGDDTLTIADNGSTVFGGKTYKDSDSDDNSISVTGVFKGFDFKVVGSVSNAPGDSTLGTVTLNINTLKNTNTSASGINTLTILTSSDGFNAPNPPVDLVSKVGGTGVWTGAGAGDKFTFQSFFAEGGALFETGDINPDTTVYSTATQTVTAGQTTNPDDTKVASISYPDTYTLTAKMVITLKSGAKLSSSPGGEADVVPTPAPGGALLFASALPLLGLFGWSRRRSSLV